MQKANWNKIRSYILSDMVAEMSMYLTEQKHHDLYVELGKHFNGEIKELSSSQEVCYYDKPLCTEICNFISEEYNFNYISKPTLRKNELDSICAALDTMMVTIYHCKHAIPNFVTMLKYNIATELSNNYDIATLEFVDWYENIFTNLAERIKEETNQRNYIDNDIIENIKVQIHNINYKLFTKMVLFIRSQLADNLNYSLD